MPHHIQQSPQSPSPHILIIEDDRAHAESVALQLRLHGYQVTLTSRGEGTHPMAQACRPDLLLLGLPVPGMTDLQACRMAAADSARGLLVMGGRGGDGQVVQMLEAGADDYLRKPLSAVEVAAHVNALLRRVWVTPAPARQELRVGDLLMDLEQRQVWVGERTVELRLKEYELLRMLAAHPGEVLGRKQLLEGVWGDSEYLDPATLPVHAYLLRKKIERDPARPERLLTVRGEGYRLVAPGEGVQPRSALRRRAAPRRDPVFAW